MTMSRPFATQVLPACVLVSGLMASAPALAADTYEIDPVHSSVIFRIKHFNASWFYGRFNGVEGTVTLDEQDLTRSSVQITIKTASVDTNNEKRDTHLKSPDFFDAKQYPEMTFKSKKVTPKDSDTLSVTGDLTVHGVTEEITVDVDRVGMGKDAWGGTRMGCETVFTINRAEFGVSYMPDGLGDVVKLLVSLEGVKK